MDDGEDLRSAGDQDADAHERAEPRGLPVAQPEQAQEEESERREFHHPQVRIEIERKYRRKSEPQIPARLMRFLQDAEEAEQEEE